MISVPRKIDPMLLKKMANMEAVSYSSASGSTPQDESLIAGQHVRARVKITSHFYVPMHPARQAPQHLKMQIYFYANPKHPAEPGFIAERRKS
jgi:hypothetical protein